MDGRAIQFLRALFRLHKYQDGRSAAGLQKSANGDELALLIAAIHKLLIDVGGSGEAGSDCDVDCIVHDGLYDFERFLGNGSAEKSFLKRCARAGEDMWTAVKTRTAPQGATRDLQWHRVARQTCHRTKYQSTVGEA
jgi:hypothetical protein